MSGHKVNEYITLNDEQFAKFEEWKKTLKPMMGKGCWIGVGFTWSVMESTIGDLLCVKHRENEILWLDDG